MNTVNLSKRAKSWAELQHRLLGYAMRYPGSRMIMVLATEPNNQATAARVMVQDIARMAAYGRIQGHVVGTRMEFANGSSLHIFSYQMLDYCRGLISDILVVPEDAPKEVLEVVYPTIAFAPKPLLVLF